MSTKRTSLRLRLALFLVSCFSTAVAHSETFPEKFEARAQLAQSFLFDNISPAGAARGAVVASPSKQNPDYFYHWVRDAALVMNTVLDLYENSNSSSERYQFKEALYEYARFSRSNQESNAPAGLGEPKFYADGNVFFAPWGRPQNDSPALRAITLIHFADILIAEGNVSSVIPNLYNAALPAESIIKRDLEYVAHNWQTASFDIWEEVLGQHFYTLLVQRRALVSGAKLADKLGDPQAANFYRQEANSISQRLLEHRDSRSGKILTTLRRTGGIDYKASQLDSQVILAINHAVGSDGFFAHSDDLALSTFNKTELAFQKLYSLNQQGYNGTGIGRYPEDTYDGYTTSGQGNPWFLSTLGFGEFLLRLKKEFEKSNTIEINSTNMAFYKSLDPNLTRGLYLSSQSKEFSRIVDLIGERANEYIDRALFHGSPSGRLSEQFNRNSGFMQGSHDLTWSYASLITAYQAYLTAY